MDVESKASRGNVLVGGTGSSDLRWWRAIHCAHLCALTMLGCPFGEIWDLESFPIRGEFSAAAGLYLGSWWRSRFCIKAFSSIRTITAASCNILTALEFNANRPPQAHLSPLHYVNLINAM